MPTSPSGMNSIFIIAHAPLATALRQCALHVFPDCEPHVVAFDVLPNVSPEETLAAARITLEQALRMPRARALVLADVCIRGWWPVSICRCCCAW
jgi:PTS system mannose-specific IIA component